MYSENAYLKKSDNRKKKNSTLPSSLFTGRQIVYSVFYQSK